MSRRCHVTRQTKSELANLQTDSPEPQKHVAMNSGESFFKKKKKERKILDLEMWGEERRGRKNMSLKIKE